jgi:hypothetical protein
VRWLKLDENVRRQPTVEAEVMGRLVRGEAVRLLADGCGQGFSLVLMAAIPRGWLAVYIPTSVLSAERLERTPPLTEQLAAKCADLKKRVEQFDPAVRAEEEARREKSWSQSAPLTFAYRYAFDQPVLIRREPIDGDQAPGIPVRWRALSILADDCGEGWMLVSLPYGDRFIAGYIRRGSPAGQRLFSELCQSDLVDREDRLMSAWHTPVLKTRPIFVLAAEALVRSGPEPEAPAMMKLGYGAPVDFVSPECEEDSAIIALPGDFGYVAKGTLGAPLLTEKELLARQTEAASPAEKAFWAVQRAHRYPGAEASARAVALQNEARASLRRRAPGPCDTFFGSCAVVAPHNDPLKLDAAKLPDLAKIPIAPWWILPSATEAAVPAVFHSARIQLSGECNCCGCVSCQTTLEVDLESLGKPGEPVSTLGASVQPPASWMRQVSTAPCADPPGLERIVTSDPKGTAALAAAAANPESGKPSAPTCLPASDGSAWWTQSFGEEDTDWPTHVSAHVEKGKVTRVAPKKPVAARDLDGDGDVDVLWPCPYGRLCTDQTEKARSGP